MKKGQMEIVGLMVIVLLILFAGIIFIRFRSSTAEQPDIVAAARENIELANFLNSFMSLSVKYGCDKQVKDAIEMCIDDTSSVICGFNACDFVRKTAAETTEVLLDKGDCFEFNIAKDQQAMNNNNILIKLKRIDNPAKKFFCSTCDTPKQVEDFSVGMYARIKVWRSCGSP